MTPLYVAMTLILSYFIGSIPFGLLVAKIFNIADLRTSGSGNIGATNAWRVGGKKAGLLTFSCDFLKSFLPVLLLKHYCGYKEAVICGAIIIIGHMFPIWLRFRGGKGIASLFGLLLGATPELGLLVGIIWVLIFKLCKISSLASLISMSIMALLSFFYDTSVNYTYVIIFIIVCIKHKDNIIRLIDNTEGSIK